VELIKPDVHEWDEQLVRQTFSAEDADAILCIPICEQHDDFVAWHYDSKGLFSVTSAYRVHADMLLRQSNVQRGENSSGSAWREKVWQAIWSVNCPAKVHHFLWRFAHNSHPLRMNIARRGVELDTRCTVRCRLFEDGRHLFLRCKEVKNFWRSIQLERVRRDLLNTGSPLEILEHILDLPEEHKLKSVCLLWMWWAERNKANHGERRMSSDELQHQLVRHVGEWREFYKPKKKL
jgi:hypothetical protein